MIQNIVQTAAIWLKTFTIAHGNRTSQMRAVPVDAVPAGM